MSPTRQALRIAAVVELATLLLLLANLFTVHWEAVSSLAGPTHGCAYLLVVILTWRQPGADPPAKATALLPGVGGLIVLRRLSQASTASRDRSGDAAAPRTDP
jgi:hypothetical protein